MEKAWQEIKKYLIVEKNASPHTLDSYRNDISKFQDVWSREGQAIESSTMQVDQIDGLAVCSCMVHV